METTNKESKAPEQPQVIAWANNPDYQYSLTMREMELLRQFFAPYEWIFNTLKAKADIAVQEGGIVPVFEKDEAFVERNPIGKIVGIKPEFFTKDTNKTQVITPETSGNS